MSEEEVLIEEWTGPTGQPIQTQQPATTGTDDDDDGIGSEAMLCVMPHVGLQPLPRTARGGGGGGGAGRGGAAATATAVAGGGRLTALAQRAVRVSARAGRRLPVRLRRWWSCESQRGVVRAPPGRGCGGGGHGQDGGGGPSGADAGGAPRRYRLAAGAASPSWRSLLGAFQYFLCVQVFLVVVRCRAHKQRCRCDRSSPRVEPRTRVWPAHARACLSSTHSPRT